MSVRLDLLQAGLVSAVRGMALANTSVVWAPSEFPRGAATNLVALRLLDGPTPARPIHGVDEDPITATITVADATVGAKLSIDANGARVSYEVQGGDTVEDIRDELLELVQASVPGFRAVATDVSTDAIGLTASAVGALWGLSVSGADLTLATPSTRWVHSVTHHAVSTVEVQCFGASRHPMGGAASMAAEIVGLLYMPSTLAALERFGLSVWGQPSAPVDLTSLSGAGWESRAAFQIEIAQRSYAASTADVIESVAAELTTDGIPVEVEVEEP